VAIKQLLEALTQWSNGRMTETDVSDVYVRLGNDFNAAVAAFSQYNIDMRFVHFINYNNVALLKHEIQVSYYRFQMISVLSWKLVLQKTRLPLFLMFIYRMFVT